MTTVAVLTTTRADLSPLLPVVRELGAAPDLRPVVLTGVGVDEAWLREQVADAVAAEDVHVVASAPDDDARAGLVALGPRISAGTAAALQRVRPDVLVVLGDRWELLYAVPPAVILQVPVVHLHGGEVTEGALDERVRHAVTKLADAHCVATQEAAERLHRLGEAPASVHVTGAPGLDRLRGVVAPPDAELDAVLGVGWRRPLAVVTYHPPTAVADVPVGEWAEAVFAETAAACGTTVITAPGVEPGRAQVLEAMERVAAAYPSVRLVPNLGADYPRVLAAADVLVGNSSSGIIESASFRLPTVDVGDRQKGRTRGANVVHCDEGREAVRAALATALDPAFRAGLAGLVNPYGDGRAAPRIVEVVRLAARAGAGPKPFHDVTRRTG